MESEDMLVAVVLIVPIGSVFVWLVWFTVMEWRRCVAEVREMDRKRGGPPVRPIRRQDPDSITGTGLDGLL